MRTEGKLNGGHEARRPYKSTSFSHVKFLLFTFQFAFIDVRARTARSFGITGRGVGMGTTMSTQPSTSVEHSHTRRRGQLLDRHYRQRPNILFHQVFTAGPLNYADKIVMW